jgi:hypothetical protein
MHSKSLRFLAEVLFYLALAILLIQPLHAAWEASGFSNAYVWQALAWKEGRSVAGKGVLPVSPAALGASFSFHLPLWA